MLEAPTKQRYRSLYTVDAVNPPRIAKWRPIHTTLLLAVHRLEYATLSQLVHFLSLPSQSTDNTSKTLKTLFHAGYLERIRLFDRRHPVKKMPMVYKDTTKGRRVLEANVGLRFQRLGDLPTTHYFLNHNLSLTDCFLHFVDDIRANDLPIFYEHQIAPNQLRLSWKVEFPWGDETVAKAIEPDRTFSVHRKLPRHASFIEYDTGEEDIEASSPDKRSVLRMLLQYGYTYKERLLRKLYGIETFNVFFITKSRVRVENIATAFRNNNLHKVFPANTFLMTDIATFEAHSPTQIEWRNGLYKPRFLTNDLRVI